MGAEVRLCLHCGSQISSIRRGKFCNRDCGDAYRKLVKQGGREIGIRKRECAAVRTGYVLFHNCVPGGGQGLDPFVPEKCRCRKTVKVETAQNLVARGEALDFETRKPFFNDRAIVQIGKLLRTPRAMTIERANCERITQDYSLKRKTKNKTIKDLEVAVSQDKAHRDEEEKLRMEIYNEITLETRAKWIVFVDVEEYDRAERESRGRCLFNFADERSSVSKDVSEPRDFLLLESDVLMEEEIETEAVEEEEPEREDGLTVVMAEEMAGVEI
jgi:hypothetical protein